MSHQPTLPQEIGPALRLVIAAMFVSLALAAIKITTGIVGNSYALVADGVESITDVVASLAVLVGLSYSVRPPDEKHPYGHGKAETFAALFVSGCLLVAAGVIAIQCIEEIRVPHSVPDWYTLPVLGLVILVKVGASVALRRAGLRHGSHAMESDAFHQASDALTSGAAFIGISLALIGGPEWAPADDWAALFACGIIAWNGIRLAGRGIDELMDASAPPEIVDELREAAAGVEGVEEVEKIRVRKSGLGYLLDIHVEVRRDLTVEEGHNIAGAVKARLLQSPRNVTDVTVHIEPHG